MGKYEFHGTVTAILPVRTYGKRNIQQAEFYCKEPLPPGGKWENEIPFVISYDPTGDRYNNLPQLDAIAVGDEVKFNFVIRGRRWTNPKDNSVRIFTEQKVCSRIEVLRRAAASAPAPSDASQKDLPKADADDDNLPF